MAARNDPSSPCPFGTHDYQIACLPPGAPRAVDIGALAALPLRIGDHFTIDSEDCVYDLVVERISHSAEGRWTARCRVFDPTCP
jgi:hypothetical protein